MIGSKRPTNLGVNDGKLAKCPDSPNCVSTQAEDETQRIDPLRFTAADEDVLPAVRAAISALPRTKLITETDDYIHAECRSLIFRFVDDIEIWVDFDNQQIHARSASRVGHSDLGVNRHRVNTVFGKLQQAISAEPNLADSAP